MKVLNLFAGLGGNRKKWTNVEITAIENDEKIANVYKAENPDDIVIIEDAHDYLLNHHKEFDFIWSSPPCQSHTQMMKATRHDVAKYIDLMLYQEIIFLDHFFDGNWVVENVKPYYKPLIRPTATLGRHLFWSNFEIPKYEVPEIDDFIISGSSNESIQKMKDWLGIQYNGNIYYQNNHCPAQILRNCVHPDLGLHIFNNKNKKNIQTTLNNEDTPNPHAP